MTILVKKELATIMLILLGLDAIMSGIVLIDAQHQQTAAIDPVLPRISIILLDSTVGSPNELLPIPQFTVNVTVTNVTDLYAWQATLVFDDAVVNITDTSPLTAWCPQDNVFSGRMYAPTLPSVGYKGKFISPLSTEVYPISYITFGASLQGVVSGVSVTGTATLASFNFTGIAPNISLLHISTQPKIGNVTTNSLLLDSNLEDIPFSTEDATVSILGTLFATFYVGTWNNVEYQVTVITNSTLSPPSIDANQKLINFNISGFNDTVGFCNITIPEALLGGQYTVLLNSSSPLTQNVISNGTHSYIYFTYYQSQSYQSAEIIGTTMSSDITIDFDSSTVTAGSYVTISGVIRPELGANISVTLLYKLNFTDEPWVQIATIETDSSSHYTHAWRSIKSTNDTVDQFVFNATWPGDANTEGASSAKALNVNQIISATTVDVTPKTAVVAGSNVTISGAVAPVEANVNIAVYYRFDGTGGTWTLIDSVKTNSSGSYTCNWKTIQTGTFELEARRAGNNDVSPSSGRITLTIDEGFSILTCAPYVLALALMLIVALIAVVIYYKRTGKRA